MGRKKIGAQVGNLRALISPTWTQPLIPTFFHLSPMLTYSTTLHTHLLTGMNEVV